MNEKIGSPELWIGFTVFILIMLALDLGVFHRKAHEIKAREAAIWSAVWISLAFCFNGWVYWQFGEVKALEFLTGFLVEKSLSVDNIFLILVTFSAFAVPTVLQHRVLFWGIVGALFMRAGFIMAGAALMERFHWVIYLFGLIVFVTGIKLWVQRTKKADPKKNPIYRFLKKTIPSVEGYQGANFFVREDKKWKATTLFFALVTIELTDLLFAVESIPAIFTITSDPFIVYTSNIFAILGLRSLYFLLADSMERFHFLTPALSLILMFIGIKIFVGGIYDIPIWLPLLVIIGLLAGAIVLSLMRPVKKSV